MMMGTSFAPSSSESFPLNTFPIMSVPFSAVQSASPFGMSNADPNSVELFKSNIQMSLQELGRVQALARNALDNILNAYASGNSPAQTESSLEALRQALQFLHEQLRQTGVGALPLITIPAEQAGAASALAPLVPPEAEMMLSTSNALEALFNRRQRSQESAGVVANLLQTSDRL